MSWDEEERRVATILKVKEGESLPAVSRKALKTYHAYLKANLEFPFTAKVEDLDAEVTIYVMPSVVEEHSGVSQTGVQAYGMAKM